MGRDEGLRARACATVRDGRMVAAMVTVPPRRSGQPVPQHARHWTVTCTERVPENSPTDGPETAPEAISALLCQSAAWVCPRRERRPERKRSSQDELRAARWHPVVADWVCWGDRRWR